MAYFVILLIIFGYIAAIYFDKARIRNFMDQRGHTLLSIDWRIFGHGWLSESGKDFSGNRIYEVTYRDVNGNVHHAWSKPAIFGGVYLSEDEIVSLAPNLSRDARDTTTNLEDKIADLERQLREARSQIQNTTNRDEEFTQAKR